MTVDILDFIAADIARTRPVKPVGTIREISGTTFRVTGLTPKVALGDRVQLVDRSAAGEVVHIAETGIDILIDGSANGARVGAKVILLPRKVFSPHPGWIGRVIDPDGQPLDERPLLPGTQPRALNATPPPANRRRALGARLSTGIAVFDTMLPIVRGQRIGLFAGSGVGKSTLLAALARQMEADVIVIGLVGERGRELREFIEDTLGEEGMSRSVIVAATSDRAPQTRQRCSLAATATAEYFRDQGLQVLLLIDSVTRFAEAHREVAAAAGEPANLRGYPATTPSAIAKLCERAGPGTTGCGDITAIYTVLVAGSDMEEPVADMLRGVLDGHVVMDRAIAERGRFPAIDVTRSVSRSLPDAASPTENELIRRARLLMGTYAQSELMIQSGLYVDGTDQKIDDAIRTREPLETFLSNTNSQSIAGAFHLLQKAIDLPGSASPSAA